MLGGKNRRLRMQAAVWLAAPDAPADCASTYLPRLLADPSPITRSLALGWCAEREKDGVSAALHAGLLDRSGKVRAIAQFHLPQLEGYDVAGFYREAVLQRTGRSLNAALEGMGETGVAADARLIVPHATSPCAATRKAALRALARLDAPSHCELFLEALQNRSRGISRQGFLALMPAAGALSPETLEAILRGSQYAHVRRRTLSLVRLLPKWDSVRLLMRFIGEAEQADPLNAMAVMHLREWLAVYNLRHQVQPSTAQINALREVVGVDADRLERTLAREVTSLVKDLQKRQG